MKKNMRWLSRTTETLLFNLGQLKFGILGASLVVQLLKLWAPNEEGLGLIPGMGTISHMLQPRSWVLQLRPAATKYIKSEQILKNFGILG